jgi:hypothetical protein
MTLFPFGAGQKAGLFYKKEVLLTT